MEVDTLDSLPLQMVDKESDQQGVPAGNYTVTPWGPDNLFPNQLRMLFENNLVPGLIDFKADMILELVIPWKTTWEKKRILSRSGNGWTLGMYSITCYRR